MVHSSNASALYAAREAMHGSTEQSRAELIEEVAIIVRDHVKFRAPGGEGLDGRDGPERQSLGGVITESIRHHDEMRRRVLGIQE